MTDFKTTSIIILVCLSSYLFLSRTSYTNYNNQKKELDSHIKMLEKRNDSLNIISINLQNEYSKLELNYKKDSLKVDSLNDEIYIANNKVVKSETKAKIFINKYSNDVKKLDYLENNKNNKKGDSLLRSLSKKIN